MLPGRLALFNDGKHKIEAQTTMNKQVFGEQAITTGVTIKMSDVTFALNLDASHTPVLAVNGIMTPIEGKKYGRYWIKVSTRKCGSEEEEWRV